MKKEKKLTMIVFIILRIFVIGVLIRQIMLKNWFLAFTCLYTLILFNVPKILTKKYKVELPGALEWAIYIFVFCSEILGEIGKYYLTVPWWDNLLHCSSGFILAGVGISTIDLLNKKNYSHFSLSPKFVTLTSICFSMTLLVFWEFIEFSSDYLFKTDMQKDTIITEISSVEFNEKNENKAITKKMNEVVIDGKNWTKNYGGYIDIGLYDTMIDLIDGFIGTLIFSIFGSIYLKKKDEKSIASKFIPKYSFASKQTS